VTRPLRILLVANDGFSAGHVVRTLAIARGLARGAARRGIELSTVLATTSEADALLANEPIAVVRLPAPVRARAAGLTDGDRRRLVRATIEATVESFAPDLIVVDTFPNGPHGELAGIGRPCKRALVRRAVPDERVEVMTAGLDNYDRLILVDDAGFAGTGASIPSVIVPPITLDSCLVDRDAARRALDLPLAGRVIAVAAGGGGDADGMTAARMLAASIARLDRDATVVLALGPLAPSGEATATTSIPGLRPRSVEQRDAFVIARSTATTADPSGRTGSESSSSIVIGAHTALGSSDPIVGDAPAASAVPTWTLAAGSAGASTDARVRALRVAPLQPYLGAFDAVVSSAGYNTAHELAAARIPAILFPLPRPFDDQMMRAVRLAAAGHAHLLAKLDDAAVSGALAWARTARCPGLVADGADRAADALFDLVGAR
jgi:predicted glycosyltransferase